MPGLGGTCLPEVSLIGGNAKVTSARPARQAGRRLLDHCQVNGDHALNRRGDHTRRDSREIREIHDCDGNSQS